MKNRFLKALAGIFASAFVAVWSAFAATAVDHFEVELSPKSVKVWEALDLTIKAVDKNNAVVTDYKWTVLIFSQSNPDASMPIILKDSTYTFKDSDQWVVKFENWVKFTKAWKQEINIFDFENEKIFGKDEATISDAWTTWTSEISFISPEDWLTIWEAKVKVSGSTVKNHKVKLIVNWTENFDLTSNNEWIFEKEVDKLKDWENTFKAQVMDAKGTVIWETKEIKVKVESNGLSIKSLKLIPEEVFTEWAYAIELISSTWLKEVSVVINDSVINLKEDWEWIYKWNSFAPKKAWNYKVDVNLVNDMWHKLNELWVATLKVKELNAPLKEEKKEEVSTWKTEEPTTQEPTKTKSRERDSLKITWLKLVELKTKSILTWDRLEKAKSYNIYKKNPSGWLDFIVTVKDPSFEVIIEWDKVKYEDFYVRANGQDEDWEYEWLLSDPTKIKTWPEMLIILLVSLFFAGLFLFLKWRKKA